MALNDPKCAVVTHSAFPDGVLLEVLDVALDAPKCAIVVHFVWVSQRGAVGGA